MASATLAVTQLAKILDVTPQYVAKLTRDGILQRAVDEDGNELRGRYTLLSIREYCRYLRSLARLDDTSESRTVAFKNVKLEAESEMSVLRLREFKGQLHESRHIEFVWTSILTRFKARLLALPSRVARLCVGKNFRQILDLITREIELVLRELSNYTPDMFAKDRDEFLEDRGIDLGSLGDDDGDNGEETPEQD